MSKELDDLLSIKVSKFQREFVAEKSLAVAEAYAAEKEVTNDFRRNFQPK